MMKTTITGRDLVDLLALGALWGASFLFMRMGAADFGPAPLAFVRCAGASLFLLPLLLLRGQGAALRLHWRRLLLVGLLNSALPFALFALAALSLSAALLSIFNATAPIWGAVVAWLWLGDTLQRSRILGLVIGIAGVVGLAWGKVDFKPGDHGVSPALAMAACVAATLCYGLAANATRRYLVGVPAMAVAAGSQVAAALLLAVPALAWWPATSPSTASWASAVALALLCTGVAYVLFFRLIANVGAANAIAVTLLIPAFAMLWGWLLLAEQPTASMLAGCAVILLGTALATGLLRRPGPPAAAKTTAKTAL